jgi:hypothetical protein
MSPRSVTLVLVAALLGCSSTNVRLNRGWDEPGEEEEAWEAQSPDAFVDRLGEPDEWRNEGEDDDLRMTAVWKCLDGKDREVTWRHQDSDRGVRRWVVVSDTLKEAECE